MPWTKEQCERFYTTLAWKKKRAEIRRRDHNECQWCKKKGRATFSGQTGKDGRRVRLVVHHIKHLDDYPELRLVDDNLITLCDACHMAAHPEKYGNLKQGGGSLLPADLKKEKW